MSVNLIPGYDFGINEVVTATKLAAWLSGIYNDGTITLADLGLEFPTVSVAATRTSAVSEGTLTLDTTHGCLCVATRWGQTPFALTRGSMFTRRATLDDGDYATARYWYSLQSTFYRDLGAPGAPVLPASTYSAGEPLVGLGVNFDASCIDVFSSSAYLRGMSLWPSEDHEANGVVSQNSSATMFHFLVAIGGWLPLRATCASSAYTANSISSAAGDLVTHGATTFLTTIPASVIPGSGARRGQRAGDPAVYQFAYVYPHWDYNAAAAGWPMNGFF